jgi:hypothetical protein
MPENAGYYVWGLKELRAAMAAASVEPDLLREANARVSTYVAARARANAPIGPTGRLATTVRGTRQIGRAVVRAGSAAVPYAGSIHYGWPGRPNPSKGWRGGPYSGAFYIINAAQASEDVWLETYMQDLEAIIDKIAASTPSK